jgi:UDP-GlcNAc3NAcA epimerase
MMKLAPLWSAMHIRGIDQIWMHTGQHHDANLNLDFVKELSLPMPVCQLDTVVESSDHERLEGMKQGLLREFLRWGRSAIVVYGDTWSTLAGAQVAKQLSWPLIHVESGLRSGNFEMPEESIRMEVDRLADVHWCPSDLALKNLRAEGVVKQESSSVVVGDLMLDALKWMDPVPHEERGGVVMTMHRNTNVDNAEYRRLWLDAAVLIAEQRPVFWSVHPRWKKWATEEEKQILRRSKIQEFGPVSHQQMIKWCASAAVVLTDSGGLQKEAYALHTPVAVLRPETEWVELLASDGVCVFPPNEKDVLVRLLTWIEERERVPAHYPPVYGEGRSAMDMVDHYIKQW